jgi:hypothetical protein
MQIKTTMRYYFIAIKIDIIKKARDKCWWGCEDKRTHVDYWWEYKLVQSLMENNKDVPKEIKNSIIIWPSNPSSGYKPKWNIIECCLALLKKKVKSCIWNNMNRPWRNYIN